MRLAALLLALCLAGCGPNSLEACMEDASTKPTDMGVRLAANQCTKRFQKPSEIDKFLDSK